MTRSRRLRVKQGSQTGVTFRSGRNVTLEKAIKRDMPNASAVEVRFHAIWPPSTPQPSGAQYWQVLRGVVVEALADHMSGDSVLPHDIAKSLHRALYLLNQGEQTALLVPRRSSGGRGNRRKVATQDQIDAAIDYWFAVEMGRIHDTKPRKTLAQAFHVSPRQISRWVKETGNRAQRNFRFNEHWSAYERYGRPQDIERLVKKMMEFRAQEYRDTHRTRRGRVSGVK